MRGSVHSVRGETSEVHRGGSENCSLVRCHTWCSANVSFIIPLADRPQGATGVWGRTLGIYTQTHSHTHEGICLHCLNFATTHKVQHTRISTPSLMSNQAREVHLAVGLNLRYKCTMQGGTRQSLTHTPSLSAAHVVLFTRTNTTDVESNTKHTPSHETTQQAALIDFARSCCHHKHSAVGSGGATSE